MGWPQPFPRRSAPKWRKIALKMSVISANFKKMEVLRLFLAAKQAFSFRIVVWDSKLLRHGNLSELGPF